MDLLGTLVACGAQATEDAAPAWDQPGEKAVGLSAVPAL